MSLELKSLKKSAGFYLTNALALTALSVILRIINLIFFFDSEIGYYKAGSVLPIISNVILIVGVLFFVVFSFLKFRKVNVSYPNKTSPLVGVTSVIAAFGSVLLLANDLKLAIGGSRVSFLIAALSFMTALYFICAVAKIKHAYLILTGCTVILRLVFMLGSSYFNKLVQMNAPDKVLFGFACVFSMLFIVSEMKLTIGSPRSWIYMASAASAALIGAVSSIPSIIAYHLNLLPENNGLYTEYYLILGISLYALSRFAAVARSLGASQTDEPNAETSDN